MSGPAVIRIKPFHYIHVLDNNTNVTRVVLGPKTFTRQDHEQLVSGPTEMIIIPPRHYCIITNPILRDANGKPATDANGQIKIRHGDEEIRFEQDPFPLYPGETLYGKVSPLQVVAPNTALHLRAIRDYKDGKELRHAGDEWLFRGPGTYVPRVELQVVQIVRAIVIAPNSAVRLRAKKEFVDPSGVKRKAGEEWLLRETGAYLPTVEVEIVQANVVAHVLTDSKAIHLQAEQTFTDVYGKERKAGEEWLVTSADAETHIVDVCEKLIGEVKLTTLNNRQYTIVLDPSGPDGKPQLGKKELRKGPSSFFLRPGERLESGVRNVHVLDSQEALLLCANEAFTDETGEKRKPGDRWMIFGPADFIPSVEVSILEKRTKIALDENEGIYVRSLKTGKVSVVSGQSYMLSPYEELWDKELPDVVEKLLEQQNEGAKRIKNRVVTFRTPHNSAVQIYDYKAKKARVEFGPGQVMLSPDEDFTVLSLSGDKPKRPNVIKTLHLLLGPDFMTDIVIVETADHARLSLKLSYNWHFEIDPENASDVSNLFCLPDFVGDATKAIASRVRGAVASVPFDEFHKHSALVICKAVFGVDADGEPKNRFKFSSNNLVISNIDIQSVEPVDQRTRDGLQKSVQLAIEITTSSQEATARHEAARFEQEAKGRLERQKIQDEAKAEEAKRNLLQLQAESATVEASGQATSEARAKASSAAIEGEAAVKLAQLKADADRIKSKAEIELLQRQQTQEITYQKSLNEIQITRAKELATIESGKFKAIVNAIGSETIKSIAKSGPEMQAKLLQGLGLQGFLITDGNAPINLISPSNIPGGAPVIGGGHH